MGCTSSKSLSAPNVNQHVPTAKLVKQGSHEESRAARHGKPRHYYVEQALGLSTSSSSPVFPNYMPQEVANYYGFPPGTGQGQKVAIISMGCKVDMAELKQDFTKLGITLPKIYLVDVGDIPKDQDAHGDLLETLLDVQVIGAINPLAIITIYRAARDWNAFAGAVEQAVEEKNSVISISWGSREGAWCKPLNDAFKKAKDAGITVCCATGDKDSTERLQDGKVHCEFPACSPYVLACGGTQLEKCQETIVEVVWNQGGGGTGGGVSEIFELPDWQLSAGIKIKSENPGHASDRVIPDVAGLAAPGDYKIARHGEFVSIGGTSAVAPLWSALMVRANEERAALHKGPIGFVNPILYQKAATEQSTLFYDITIGNNRPSSTSPGYDALPGYDACTGWGVPKAAAICVLLANI